MLNCLTTPGRLERSTSVEHGGGARGREVGVWFEADQELADRPGPAGLDVDGLLLAERGRG